MSKLVTGLVALLMATTSLAVAEAQPGRRGPPGGRGGPCGGPLVGQAPDIMTYDRSTGTQIFVGGGPGDANVSAYNAQTRSAAGLTGDLSKPGLVASCAVDGFNNQSYGVSSDRPGELSVNSRDGRGDRWAFTRADGRVEIWDPRGDNRCFKSGVGLFNSGVRSEGC
jgi:hypothetical protein